MNAKIITVEGLSLCEDNFGKAVTLPPIDCLLYSPTDCYG